MFLIVIGALLFLGNLMGFAPGYEVFGWYLSLGLIVIGAYVRYDQKKRERPTD